MSIGIQVLREVPLERIIGVLNGTLRVSGGVIRNHSGQIVTHLASPGNSAGLLSLAGGTLSALASPASAIGSIVNGVQIQSVGKDVKRSIEMLKELGMSLEQVQTNLATLQKTATATLAVSGLGVVVSVAGFAYLTHRMNVIDQKLDRLAADVKEVKEILHSQSKAQLQACIDYLRQAEHNADLKVRHELLMQSKSGFTTLTHQYKSMWGSSKDPHQIDGLDECYTLAFTGQAIATSELGMHDVAASELRRHYEDWRTLSRQHCFTQFVKGDPQRLLDGGLVDVLPTKDLVDLLDFSHGTNKGIDWIDDLRRSGSASKIPKVKLPGNWGPFNNKSEQVGIALSKKLLARADILDTSVAQFEFLRDHKLSSLQFAEFIENAAREAQNEAFCLVAA